MKQSKSFLTRLLALALALVLVVSNANLGLALTAFAEGANKVTAGELVADNYELTDAEKALLKSGYLAEATYDYNVPANPALVAVDTDEKTISAGEFEDWVATTASIVVGDEVKEGPIDLVDGKATYTYDGNAFAVRVEYVLNQNVAADTQKQLLNAGYYLKAAIADLDAVYNKDVTAYVASIAPAMEILIDMADEDGYTTSFGSVSKNFKLNEVAAAAVQALNAELAANGDKLNFQLKNVAYGEETSKVAAVVNNGASYKECIEQTHASLQAIAQDPTIKDSNIQLYLELNDEALYTQWMTFLNNLNKAVDSLESAAKAEWAILDVSVLKDGADYAAVDALVAALGTQTAVTVKETLNIAATTIQANLSMFNVAVTVKLQTVEDKVDSDKLVENEIVKNVTLTLAKDATKSEILDAVVASGIEAQALAAWGEAYVEGQFIASATALPETLTEDVSYTVTYAPKTYTVTFGTGFDKAALTVPYGYQLTLEKHADSAQAYDYTVNGTKLTQGTVYTVVGDTTVARATGKAYSGYGLYNTIADNYANDALKAILKSGALNGDATLYLRKPDPADAASLLTLASDKLTAVAAYSADYKNLNWVPYTYGEEGNENYFGGTYVVDVVENTVNAIYRLDLTNYSEADVEKILGDAIALKADAADQIATLDRLVAYHDQMGQLDLTKLGALRGTIEVTTLNEDPAKNAALKQEFYSIVSGLINNNLGANEKLNIYNMLTAYSDENAGGLTYYYNNSAAVIAEINSLSNYLGGLLKDEDSIKALEILTEKAGFGEYAEKIQDLERVITEVKNDLTAPAAMINLSSENLNKLIKALSADGAAEKTGSGSPYLTSAALTAVDDSVAIVQIIVEVQGVDGEKTFKSPELNIEEKISAAVVNELIAQANAYAAEYLGEHYQASGISDLKALIDTVPGSKTTTKYLTYVPAKYDVKIEVEGADDVVVDTKVDSTNPTIELKAHETVGWIYVYTIGDRQITVDSAVDGTAKKIELSVIELSALKAGTLNMSVKAVHKAMDDLEDKVESASTLQFNDDKTALVATIDAGKDGVMQFALDLVDLGYSKILLNGEALLETTKEGETLLSLQVLANAILNDNTFGSKKLVALNAANGGEVFTAKMDLGTSSEIVLADLDFTFVLSSVPAQMGKVANGLDAVKNYMSFCSNNGEMLVTLNLPEKVYELYLTALIATGNVDLDDVNAVNNAIAFNFLYDYIDYILGTEADAQSFQNTLDMLKVNAPINVAQYNDYYELMKKALTADGVKIDRENVKADLTAVGEKSINKLMGMVGINPDDFSVELAMVKEYKPGENLTVSVAATLTDTTDAYDFEAVVIDLAAAKAGAVDIKNGGKAGLNKGLFVDLAKGNGIANGLDFTSDLSARLAETAGESIVVLLADIEGDLYFTDGAILDLNGFTVDGDITANGGNVIIVDSTLATFEAGTVTGAVNGSVHILAGCYPNDTVETHLKDGYKVTDGYVHNVLYWIEGSGNDLTIVLNSDYMYEQCVNGYLPGMTAIAGEIAADMATKYLVPAAVSVDGYSVYSCNFDKLISLLKSSTTIKDAANMLVDCISVSELKGLANAILDDLTDLHGIYNALKTNAEIGDYTLTYAPWAVTVDYVAEGDYIDFGLAANHKNAKSTTLGLRIAGDNIVKLMELICELRDILSFDVNVDLKKPNYDEENKALYLAGNAAAAVEANLFNSCTYSNVDYITIFTVLFANSGADNSAAMVDALNKGNMVAVKAAFDEMTVRDVLEAMKALDRSDDFITLANAVGVTVDTAAADRLESLYHLFIVAAGKAFEVVENGTVNNAADKVIDKAIDATDSDRLHNAIDKVTDKVLDKVGSDRAENAVDKVNGKLEDKVTIENLNKVYGKVSARIDAFLQTYAVSNLDKKLGALDQDNDGAYELTLTASRNPDVTRRGYTLDVDIEKITLSLKVIIFDNDCLWGDVNHDGKVTPFDADLILKYYVGLDPADFVCAKKADVNCDGKITPFDADLVLKYYVELISELPYIEE